MAGVLPPPPTNEPVGSFAWLQWFNALQQLYSVSGSIPWALVDTAGSNITDIANRAHNNLTSIQGGTSGSYYHLKSALKSSKTHDFGSTGAGATSTTTQTVTGAGTDDVVIITPNTPTAGMVYWGYVSAADTVTIVAQNVTTGAVDPGSTIFYILVLDN